jgi:hypothetical protein
MSDGQASEVLESRLSVAHLWKERFYRTSRTRKQTVALLHRVDLARQLEVDVGHEGILRCGASGCATASGGNPGAVPSALTVACACRNPMRLADDAAEGSHARRLRS